MDYLKTTTGVPVYEGNATVTYKSEPKPTTIFEQLGQLDMIAAELKGKSEQIRSLVGPASGKTESKELGPASNISSNLYFLINRLQEINLTLSDALFVLVNK